MKDSAKVVGVGVLVVIGLTGVILYFAYGSYFLRKDLGPKQAEVDRQIFENSPSYIQGKAQEMGKLRLEFEMKVDAVERTALRRRILEVSDSVDMTKLSPDIQTFVRDLRNLK